MSSPLLSMPLLSISCRTRSTPFSAFNRQQGMKACTVYNHMLLPTVFRSVEQDYWHLKQHVQIWDVGVERQVEISGPDAFRLVQMMTPRDLGRAEIGQCLYAPLVDDAGGLINDPIIIKLDTERYWLSIADSDVMLWAKGLALGYGLDVRISEPQVWPLAVQGPKSDDLMARVFGEEVRAIRFFRSRPLRFQDHALLVARSGWSKQGGFEIYVDDAACGRALVVALWDAGQPFSVGAGCPNIIERIEGGLLSYGNDMTLANNPLEVGLEKYCQLDGAFDFIGKQALRQIRAKGPARKIRGLKIEALALDSCSEPWPVMHEGRHIGSISSAAMSPGFNCGVALAMMDNGFWDQGLAVEVMTPSGQHRAIVYDLPFTRAIAQ